MGLLKTGMRFLFAALFVVAGTNHFLNPSFYMKIMPPYLPWHWELVILSGVFEMVLGLLLFAPRTASLAAWGLIALLIAIFPANLHMALHPDHYPRIPEWFLWARLPLQGVLIAWAYWFTGAQERETPTAQ